MTAYDKSERIISESSFLDECLYKIAENDLFYLSGLYKHTHLQIYSYVLSLLKNSHDAQDVTHDCYLMICKNACQYSSRGKPLAWMMTIARNLALSRLKERSRYADSDIAEYQIAEENAMSNIDRITLQACLDTLNDQERQVVVLHAISGFKHREIAAILNMSLSGVLSKYHRAMKKLKAQYAKGMKDE